MTDIGTGQGTAPDTNQGQPVVDQSVSQTTETSGQQQQSTINPAWNDLLGVVPSQLHSQVTPHLQQWDKNYQESIQKVHSQYEPWKNFVDNGVDPNDVEFSLGLMNAISTNPQEVVQALQEWIAQDSGDQVQQQFGQNQPGQQGQFDPTQQNQGQSDPNDPLLNHPKFKEMEQALQTMAQILVDQRETEQSAQQDEELDTAIKGLKQTHGEFDEEYVLGRLAASGKEEFTMQDLEQGVQAYKQLEQNILTQQRQPGPPVLGSGGAFPNQNPDPRKLGSQDTKSLVANMLQQAKQG